MKTNLTLLLAAGLISACIPKAPEASKVAAADDAVKAAWIEKAAAALRNGEGIGANDDMDALMAMSKEQVVAKLMADPRFGDTVLAFNLYYLGRNVNQLKTPNLSSGSFNGSYTYAPMAYAMPQAMASARAVLDGGDFYDLYGADPALLLTPTRSVEASVRQTALTTVDAQFAQVLTAFGADETAKDMGCDMLYLLDSGVPQALSQAGLDPRLGELMRGTWIRPLQSGTGECYDPAVTGPQVAARIKAIKTAVHAAFDAAASAPSPTPVKGLADLQKAALPTAGLAPLVSPMTAQGFWTPLRNSSTNFNRKRSAYMLRTYFCDDLTPLNVEVPAQHGGGMHGTEPACMACHYKLDPMGGLFRNHGKQGTDFTDAKQYDFDDDKYLSEAEKNDYTKFWKTEDGTKWQVGYYTGPKKPHAKWQGDELADIWPFLKQAPEVKQCLVRRMAEYFLGPDQVYDGLWLEEISKPLKAGATSGNEFKKVVQQLVLSNTFQQQNPEPGKCYDFPSDDDPNAERPPCEIASIVKKRCANCHSDASDYMVDFTKWIKLSDGSYGFPHLNEGGQQLSRVDSFKEIIRRITATDAAIRMPKAGAMPDTERQVLYKWLDKQITP